MTELLHRELTRKIIGVYYDVYNGTGRTYPEFIYERAMMDDLQRAGVSCRRQPEYQVFYKDRLVGLQRLDLFAAQDVTVEIKVAPELTRLHRAQAISYLKVVGKEVGLLLNFGSPEPEFGRVIFTRHSEPDPLQADGAQSLEWPADLLSADLSGKVVGGLYEVHAVLGPGFIHRIYANAVYHEMSLQGLEPAPRREYQVIYRGHSIGQIKFNHLQINDALMVFPVAIQNLDDVSVNNLKAWMKTQNVPLGILANFYPTSLEFKVLRL